MAVEAPPASDLLTWPSHARDAWSITSSWNRNGKHASRHSFAPSLSLAVHSLPTARSSSAWRWTHFLCASFPSLLRTSMSSVLRKCAKKSGKNVFIAALSSADTALAPAPSSLVKSSACATSTLTMGDSFGNFK